MNNKFAILLLTVSVAFYSTGNAQQVSLPTTAAQVPGPPAGTAMTKEYVQMVGRMAYIWGWPLVNSVNRSASFSKAPEPILMGGIVPVAYNANAMLTGYVSADQTFVTCANQDVVYGTGYMGLDKEPIVFQVPDFGNRFWVYAHYDARTDEFSEIGKAYGTKPGFYMMVGPNWNGEKPKGITAIVRSSTSLVFIIPRIFMDDTPADKAAVQPIISQVVYYPLSQFDGKMKIKDWSKLPVVPMPKSTGAGETKYVNPETFFNELPAVMKQVPPMPGEEALYNWIGSVLDAAAKDTAIMQTLKETAVATENEMLPAFLQWSNNGRSAGNGWNSPVNNGQWGTDYLNRTATAKSNMYDNRPNETKYIYTDNDSKNQPLSGQNTYAITFAKGQAPPVKGFWSVTLYNDLHLWNPNPMNRFSLGTKNKTLQFNTDGSLTLYAGVKSPGTDKESNWLQAPNGTFSLYIRAYWADKSILDGTWQPPTIQIVN
jgi:hypothetical protein